MTDRDQLLDERQLASLALAFHQGSADASRALGKWLGKPTIVEVDSLEQLPLEEATGLLNASDQPICFCSAEMNGLLRGEMMLVFDDASGLALTDMLLGQSPGTANEWTEMATSAAMETTNILCCAYLNALSHHFSATNEPSELLPSPPKFSRDFAGSLLEFALMGQAIARDQVIAVRTRFEIDATPLTWTLLMVPDAETVLRLPHLLSESEANNEE